MNYQDLIALNTNPSYSELLNCKEWQDRRRDIKKKNNNFCSICKKSGPHDYKPRLQGRLTIFVPILYDVEVDQMGMCKHVEIEMSPNSELHIHHKYYVLSRLPWEYADEDLLLVCKTCHDEIHSNEQIICYKSEHDKKYFHLTPCHRCDGTGYLPEYHYHENGVCFQCSGAGYLELI
jgi:hypothetical protein